jgi:pimeloyl-ACP methyl ester carboxylesterase
VGALSYRADDGVCVAYHDWNAEAGGRPIVLQHGFTVSSQSTWFLTGVVEALARHGRRVIAIDARGHGETDKPHDPAFYGGVRLASDLIGVLDVRNVESYDLVGYSMGAIIGVYAATRDVRVRRLVLSGAGAYLLERAKTDGAFLSVAIADALSADDPAGITDPTGAWLRKVADAARADRLALSALARSQFERLPLESITVPTLVLVGDADPFAWGAERLANAIPGARLELLPGDHLTTVHNARYATSLLDFLS